MPHPHVEVSLTRHREATLDELWKEGKRVASLRVKTLYGRADVIAAAFIDQGLKVEPKPIPENPVLPRYRVFPERSTVIRDGFTSWPICC
ncbi:MAG TPA: hypothetical protein VGJ05_14205 [Fimbriiglobus sp.]|jgi:hypothetical protein